MAVQLVKAPEFRINGKPLEEALPDYVPIGFTLTKRLLEPNKFEFVIRKTDMTFFADDIKFNIRDTLLGAMVDCEPTPRTRLANGDVDEETPVENFFHGYIQSIKTERLDWRTPVQIRCTAYSPDVRLKDFPNCAARLDLTLKETVEQTLKEFYENTSGYDSDSEQYKDVEPIPMSVEPRHKQVLLYTVQYNESTYNFLKRLAKRYGEFFYYENGEVVFGNMKELEPVTLRTGNDIECYDYDLNMNKSNGIVTGQYDYMSTGPRFVVEGYYKESEGSGWHDRAYIGEMTESVYNHAQDFYNHNCRLMYELGSARINEEQSKRLENLDKVEINNDYWSDYWVFQQRKLLEKYIMADSVTCRGRANRADLKLGSVIVIEDETNDFSAERNDIVQHEPLKVVEVTYTWDNTSSRSLNNTFKAIMQACSVPPYLERDENGFLTYGDFDIYPKSGPLMGTVLDNKDPEGLGRVRVVLYWQQYYERFAKNNTDFYNLQCCTPWIRTTEPYRGQLKGSYSVPEIGEGVLVGFEHNNAECPYVIGSMYTNRHMPVEKWTEKGVVENNEYKAFRTRNGHTIEIRDKGEHGYIKIYDDDTRSYVLTFSTDEKVIRLESSGNIELKAKNNIVLNAGNNVKIEAGNNIESKAGESIINRASDSIESESNSHFIKVMDEYGAYVDEGDTIIHMLPGKVNIATNDNENVVRLRDDGLLILSQKTCAMEGQKAGIVAHSELLLKSDMTAEMTAQTTTLNGEVETVVNGGMVKIN